MGFIINIVLLLGAIGLLAVSGGYSTDAARRVTDITGWDSYPDLRSAHTLLSWSAVAAWLGLALVIILLVLYFIYGFETIEITGNLVTYLFLFGVLGLVILVGVLSAVAADKINKANVSDNKGAYKQAIIAAVLSLGTLGIIILLAIIKYMIKKKATEGNHYLLKEQEEEKI